MISKLINRLGVKRSFHYLLYKVIKLNHNKIIHTKFGVKIPFIDNKIFLYYNGYAECNIIKYIQNSHNLNTFINIGSGYGEYLFFSSINPNIRYIYGFEPVPFLYKIIKKILRLNPLFTKKIHISNCALGDFTGSTKIYINKNALFDSSLTPSNSNTVHNINIKRLDDLALKIQPPILLLIDVEGYELQVIKGAQKFIEKYKPLMIIEVWDKNIQKYHNFISKMNYKYEMIWREKYSDTESWHLRPNINHS